MAGPSSCRHLEVHVLRAWGRRQSSTSSTNGRGDGPPPPDLYAILGVRPDATLPEIKRAYR